MKKLWMVLASGLVLAGCGGSGGGGGNGGGGTTPPPDDGTPQVVLAEGSDVQFLFLTGQGRRAPEPLIALIKSVTVANGPIDQIPDYITGSLDGIRAELNGYSANAVSISTVIPSSVLSKHYSELPFEIADFGTLGPRGYVSVLNANEPRPYIVRLSGGATPPLDLRVFRGRQSTVSLTLDDAMFEVQNGSVVFHPQFFADLNVDVATNKIQSFLSDYVAFDLTAMPVAQRPKLGTGAPADLVLLSGDAIALSSGFDSSTSFEVRGAEFTTQGVIRRPVELEGRMTPGSYTLLEPDPRDILGQGRVLTAGQGIWRNFTEVLGNRGSTLAVAFPNSRNSNVMDLAIMSLSGNRVTKAALGKATFTPNGSTFSGGTFEVYPISEVGKTSPTGKVSGNLSALSVAQDAEGAMVRSGSFTFSGGSMGFPANGRFVVFRR